MIKVVALLLGCLALTSGERASRIRNGRAVTQAELERSFSFVAYALNCGANGMCSACTGTLISANTVLLSSHCFCGGGGRISVFFKSVNGQGGRRVAAHQGKRKPFRCDDKRSYQANNDIATLTLDTPVRDITPVQLECGSLRDGQRVTMIGFGRDDAGQSGTLRIGQRSTKKCKAEFTDVVCVDGNDKGATSTDHGDSGGPLLISRGGGYSQIGVTHGSITMMFMQGGRKWTETTMLWTRVGAHCGWVRS